MLWYFAHIERAILILSLTSCLLLFLEAVDLSSLVITSRGLLPSSLFSALCTLAGLAVLAAAALSQRRTRDPPGQAYHRPAPRPVGDESLSAYLRRVWDEGLFPVSGRRTRRAEAARRTPWWRAEAAAAGAGAEPELPPPAPCGARFAAVSRAVQALPTAVFYPPQELAEMPVRRLKELVESLPSSPRGGISAKGCDMLAGCLEKSDLVEVLGAPQAGSSAQECSICCDDYRSGDVLRVLPLCGHRFHLECVDRWFLSIAESDRAAACPLCNAPLSGQQPCRRRG